MRETRSTGAVIDYSYDANGNPFKIVVNVNGSRYAGYFVVNQMGDVIGIVDGSGNIVVWYRYNAWGKLVAYDYTSGTGTYLATYNCLRYRGYYFDSSLGMYYLQSRFYDPTLCRFVNADRVLIFNTKGYSNLFVYCGNSPMNYVDPSGMIEVEMDTPIGQMKAATPGIVFALPSDITTNFTLVDTFSITAGWGIYGGFSSAVAYNPNDDSSYLLVSFMLGGGTPSVAVSLDTGVAFETYSATDLGGFSLFAGISQIPGSDMSWFSNSEGDLAQQFNMGISYGTSDVLPEAHAGIAYTICMPLR